MAYAEGTSVTVDKSQLEIRKTLAKYKATGFAYGEQAGTAVVLFEMSSRRVKFALPLPVWGKTKNARGLMSQPQIEQEERRRWRCLVIAIKAKLECVASGITTFEEEFMAHIVMPNGKTVGEVMVPQIDYAYTNGKMPPLLGYDG